jgi:CheY-like chemotaxis protein
VSVGFYFLTPLTKITTLEAAFCEIQDPVIPFITSLPNLMQLDLMCNRLTDEGCASLAKATKLTNLSLSMNPLITDKTLEALDGLTNLVSLNLNFCRHLSSEGLSNLSRALPNLKQLDIIGCDRALSETKTRPLILLAEDSKVQARMISLVLNRYNFDVEVATNGEMALEMFRGNPKYDLILMDVVMPVMDGVSCVKLIREYETSHGLKRTPIIIQTADTRESQRNICLEAGASEFLSKPLDKACISLAKELMERV